MISFKIKLADKVIEVSTIYPMTKELCKNRRKRS